MTSGAKDNEAGVPTYWGASGRSLQIMITLLAMTDFLLFGYDQGVMSGIIGAPVFTGTFKHVTSSSAYEGFVVAIYAVGCLFGAITIFFTGDKLGRRNAILIGSSIMVVGVIIQVSSVHSITQFIIGRFITGIGNGINTSTVPTYQAECSKAKNRGKVICIEGGMVAIGSLTAYWIDYGCSYGPDNFTWRFPIAFQCVFAVIAVIMMTGLPESPRWLLTRHREEEAVTILAALSGVRRDDPEILLQLDIIKHSIHATGGTDGVPIKALLTNGKSQHLRRTLIGASSQFMQQVGGCNAVIYYFPILCQNVLGTDHNTALLLGGVNMIVYALFAMTSWFMVERVGRRKLYLVGTVGQGLSMVLVFACLIPGTKAAAKGAAVGLFTYIAFFGATWLPLPWLTPAEINPLYTRQKANGFSTINNWLWNFFVVMITPVLVTNIGWGTYLFFAAMNACFMPFLYYFYPETAGRSLEEIDLIFAKGYVEKISYVRAAKELPKMNEEEVAAAVRELDARLSDEETPSSGNSMKEGAEVKENHLPELNLKD